MLRRGKDRGLVFLILILATCAFATSEWAPRPSSEVLLGLWRWQCPAAHEQGTIEFFNNSNCSKSSVTDGLRDGQYCLWKAGDREVLAFSWNRPRTAANVPQPRGEASSVTPAETQALNFHPIGPGRPLRSGEGFTMRGGLRLRLPIPKAAPGSRRTTLRLLDNDHLEILAEEWAIELNPSQL